MKVLTLLGTRPEIIRLSRIVAKLDTLCDHILVHTGQNFDPALSDIFFAEMEVRAPDHYLAVTGDGVGQQVGRLLAATETVLQAERPDALLILGDTNSGLGAFIAKRQGIPVYHMEAGNRCYDDRVPEEVNRRVIDHSSDVLMPYTERSRQNLLREGIEGRRIFVTGNPINEVIRFHEPRIAASRVLDRLGVRPDGYFLVTAHRAENVDVPARLRGITSALARLASGYGLPVIVSTHPRTRARMAEFGLEPGDGDGGNGGGEVRFLPPFGFYDFVALERQARAVLSDSGTVQEECALFGVPNVTLRDVTERPETLECGSNMLAGTDPDVIDRCLRAVLALRGGWSPPPEYLAANVSETVVRIILGHRHA